MWRVTLLSVKLVSSKLWGTNLDEGILTELLFFYEMGRLSLLMDWKASRIWKEGILEDSKFLYFC